MDTDRVKSVIAAAVIIMISLAFYIPNVSAMDTAAREFETVCQRVGGTETTLRYIITEVDAAIAGVTLGQTGVFDTETCTASGGTAAGQLSFEIDNGIKSTVTLVAAVAATADVEAVPAKLHFDPSGTALAAAAVSKTWVKRDVANILSQFGAINRLVLGILPLLLILASFAYGALLVTGTGESISTSVKGEVIGLVLLQITTAFLPSILRFLVEASGATGGIYGVTNDFGGIINIVFGVVPIVMVVALIVLVGQRIYKEASSRGMMGSMT